MVPGVIIQNTDAQAAVFLQVLCDFESKAFNAEIRNGEIFSSRKDLSFPRVTIQNAAAKAAVFLQLLCAFESEAFNA